ncbi:MAG: TatD family hydrolase [Lentisphaeria bacterium]|nr:TatD family hydrolase [Lentisphaeria bacterium]MDP7741222.1 TatD family hydrolase [Lentisphaeria bacterium]
MEIFDTHFHLAPGDELGAIAARALAAGVTRLLVAGAAVGEAEAVLGQVAAVPAVFAAVGVHPHEAGKFDGDIGYYRGLAGHRRVRAIGEIGLDYYYDNAPCDTQKAVFRQFLELARETGLPAVVHCRDAYDDCYALLAECLDGGPFVVHCYTGTVEWAQRFLALGGHLSFTGILTFPRSDDVRAAFHSVPLDRLMFETDSPYLAPVPLRGRVNEPANVAHIVTYAADVLEMPAAELAAVTTTNALEFFGITADAAV